MPQEFGQILQRNLPTQYGVANPDATPGDNADAMKDCTSHFVSYPVIPTGHSTKHPTTSDASHKVPVVKAQNQLELILLF